MHCIECGEESNYHRAVVELVTRVMLGSYCVDCERRRFDDALDGASDGDRCIRCERPGHYVLPVHTVDVDCRGAEVAVESGWRVGTAPRLCFDHLFELARPTVLARRGGHGVA